VVSYLLQNRNSSKVVNGRRKGKEKERKLDETVRKSNVS
jgi:hypothetical protein